MTRKSTNSGKIVAFATTTVVVTLLCAVASAETVATGDNQFTVAAWIALAEGLGLGIAAFGGSLGQGRAVAAALEGIARNPTASSRIFTPMILGLALIESLVIYSLLISFFLNGHLGTLVAGF